MNIFRGTGDLLHILSIFLLLWKLRKSKSCVGVSCKMQEVYLIVFVCRYADLLWYFVSVYNTTMKVVLILSTAYTIYLIRWKAPISQTYDAQADNFPYWTFLMIPSALLSLTAPEHTISDMMWSFSIWLESGAILPQLFLLQRLREVENLTSHYVACLGAYRAFYILNWVYRYHTEHFINKTAWIAGAIQVALYLDFFYHYAVSKWYGMKLVLPFAHDKC